MVPIAPAVPAVVSLVPALPAVPVDVSLTLVPPVPAEPVVPAVRMPGVPADDSPLSVWDGSLSLPHAASETPTTHKRRLNEMQDERGCGICGFVG